MGKPQKTTESGTNGPGRPPIPAEDRLSRRIEIRLTAEEYRLLTQAAEREGRGLASFVRLAIAQRASNLIVNQTVVNK